MNLLSRLCRAGFATEVKAPKNIYSLEGRYATALYTAAIKSGGNEGSNNSTGDAMLTALEKDLANLSSFIKKNASAQRFLEDPTVSRAEKKSQVTNFLGKMPLASSAKLFSNFLQLLAENGRMALLPRILTAFEDLLKAHRHQIDVTIVSASDLSPDYMKTLSQKIIDQFIPSSTVPVFKNQVDAGILGGLVVHIGDKTIDLSVLSRVNAINQLLTKPM